MHRTPLSRTLRVFGMLAALAAMAGCSMIRIKQTELQPAKEASVMSGSSSRNNTTPMEPAFACLAKAYDVVKAPVVSITVGDVKDYTGKYSQAEGNAITQGGSLMLYSALGKMGNAVRLQERFDTRIAELELAYADRRQLGDGKLHAVEAGKPQVPWVPYFGGSILRSDYYIVGGITEVNYNIQSRGAEFNVSSIGGKVRTFTMNVGVDLRIVDSRSLLVVKTISMQKQITGTEVGAGIFRFFGTELLDVNMGSKNQEPLQLGVRTTIEHGLLELLGAVSGLSPQPCVDYALKGLPNADKLQAAVAATAKPVLEAAGLAPQEPAPVVKTSEPVEAAKAAEAAKDAPLPVPVNAVQNNGKAGANGAVAIGFEPNKSSLDGSALQALGELSKGLAADKQKTAAIELLTRETENLPSAQRRQLAQDRAKAVTDALVAAGLQGSRIAIEWLPDVSSPIQRQGAGMQVVARLKVTEAKAGSGW
jgi:curli biogenesis system outer membrane secretion channel CsgG/outer membrane protein OmpA-like peptidoglycan-associated protein